VVVLDFVECRTDKCTYFNKPDSLSPSQISPKFYSYGWCGLVSSWPPLGPFLFQSTSSFASYCTPRSAMALHGGVRFPVSSGCPRDSFYRGVEEFCLLHWPTHSWNKGRPSARPVLTAGLSESISRRSKLPGVGTYDSILALVASADSLSALESCLYR
jgi:hypothetical protein